MARPPKKERGLYARKDADGNTLWYCRVYLGGREQREGPFSTKTDAKNKRDDLRSQHRLGQVDPEGGWQPLGELIDRHLKLKATKKDQPSQQRFSEWWKAWFDAKGLKRVKDLTARILEDARQDLKTERIKVGPGRRSAKQMKRKPSVSKVLESTGKYREPATVNRYFVWLQSLLKPVKQKRRELFDAWEWETESKGRTRHLNPQEEATLLAALGPYANMARLAILTGLRQAEQFRLEWKDVDLEQGLLTLPRTKAGHVQHVHLSDEAKAIFRGFDSWQRSKWVFPSESLASPMDARNFYHRVWIPAVKGAGIEWATWHDLRHTYASRLAMSGHNDSTIAALLRHSGLGLVKRYAHLNQPHLRQAVESVAGFGKEMAKPTITEGTEVGTGKKPEKMGSEGERSGKPEAAEVCVVEGEKFGAPDTN
ncbi:MAG: site-specific integrase [Nitrospira sp.]|nr:site-specific integrase [Nitrospira sp.]